VSLGDALFATKDRQKKENGILARFCFAFFLRFLLYV
jgi:hypothetical protein